MQIFRKNPLIYAYTPVHNMMLGTDATLLLVILLATRSKSIHVHFPYYILIHSLLIKMCSAWCYFGRDNSFAS